jgi:hypothetical protein
MKPRPGTGILPNGPWLRVFGGDPYAEPASARRLVRLGVPLPGRHQAWQDQAPSAEQFRHLVALAEDDRGGCALVDLKCKWSATAAHRLPWPPAAAGSCTKSRGRARMTLPGCVPTACRRCEQPQLSAGQLTIRRTELAAVYPSAPAISLPARQADSAAWSARLVWGGRRHPEPSWVRRRSHAFTGLLTRAAEPGRRPDGVAAWHWDAGCPGR